MEVMERKIRQIWSTTGSSIKNIWHETGSSLKKAWIVLWAIGLTLLALGAWGDSAGFWAAKPFLTNTFSALCSAAFGIPLALVVLQRIAASETDAAEARAAHRMAVRVSADLASAAAALIEGEVSKVKETTTYLKCQRDSAIREWLIYLTAHQSYLAHGETEDSDFPNQACINALENVRTSVNGLFSPKIVQLSDEVATQWSILNTEARSRLLETGGGWLTGVEARQLDQLVAMVTRYSLDSWRFDVSELLHAFNFKQSVDRAQAQEKAQETAAGHDYITKVNLPKDDEFWMMFESCLKKIQDFISAVTELIAVSANAAENLRISTFIK